MKKLVLVILVATIASGLILAGCGEAKPKKT